MATVAAQAQTTPYERLGGRDALQRIVDRFYDLIEGDPAYARLRAMHAPDLAPMRKSLAEFLTGWCGGPRDWFEANPGKCMMSMHAPFAIDAEVAGQWAEAMERAIAGTELADEEVAGEMAKVLGRLARGMARS